MIDVACGVGYGSSILASKAAKVLAFDNDLEAIEYAQEHYAHPRIIFDQADANRMPQIMPCDAAVCFETLEHLKEPSLLLQFSRRSATRLFASVPNEAVFPWRNYEFHHRHYTRYQFERLLNGAGWAVTGWYGQKDKDSEVEPDIEGRTLVVTAEAVEPFEAKTTSQPSVGTVPRHVAILGLGPSLDAYVDMVKRLGNRRNLADEVWGINALGDVLNCDRIFHMDDVRVQEARAAAKPDSNIAAMIGWMKKHPGPIYTSIPHPDYPGTVAYPLQDVINSCGMAYFNSTCAYAVAYAVHIGVKEISLWGCDFTYPNAHQAEKGRACVEFHLGIAKARGIAIGFPIQSTIMDACAPVTERIYGYDMVHLSIEDDENGLSKVTMTPRDEIPTAAEIEDRYDHNKHPNNLVNQR